MSERVDRSRGAILRATMGLLDGDGATAALTVRDLTVEGVARCARVSKSTIYRLWPNKTALVVDTLLEHDVWRLPIRHDLPAVEAIRAHVTSLVHLYSGRRGRLIAQLIAECQYEPDALQELQNRFWLERSEAVAGLIQRAIDEGSLGPGVDAESFADLLYAPIYFRLLLNGGPLDAAFATRVFEAAFHGSVSSSRPPASAELPRPTGP